MCEALGSIPHITKQNYVSRIYKMSWVLVNMPIILATQEAEIRRIEVRSQPRQIV
jgi:hypothetical protein